MKTKTKTIPAEYLTLRLSQVLTLATRRATPKRGDVELSAVLDAVRALVRDIAARDAKQRADEVRWARDQLAKLPTDASRGRGRRNKTPRSD